MHLNGYCHRMHDRTWRGITAGLGIVVALVLLSSCAGGADDPVEVGAGAPAASGEDPAPPPSDGASDPGTTDPAAAPSEDAPEASTVPVAPGDAPSPVEGLTADELRAALAAPASDRATRARRTGPVAEPVTVAGRTLWRITIPAEAELLSSAIVVAVGGTDVGEAVATPDLTALVAVTADAAAVRAGQAVTYRWGAGSPIDAGTLEVVR